MLSISVFGTGMPTCSVKAVCTVSFPKLYSYRQHAASLCSLKMGCHLGQGWQSHPVWFNLTDTLYPTGMESALTTHCAYHYVHRFDKKKVSLPTEMFRVCCVCLF